MPSKRRKVPAYCLHKATGQAVVRIDGRDFYLGKYGTEASHEAYQRLVAQFVAIERSCASRSQLRAVGCTVNELILAYWKHAERYYCKAGQPTSELHTIRQALRPLRALYGEVSADEFGPIALKTVRQRMIEMGWARRHINKQTDRIKRMFKWGVENELLPGAVYQGLQAVAGLRLGRSGVRESEPVTPVPEASIDRVLPWVSPQVAGMIRLQLLTGMRPGEAVIMRACDLETGGNVWLYRPESHKTQHHGHQRVIALGPQAQSVLKPFLKSELSAFLFSPRDAVSEQQAQRRAKRKTPLWASHLRHQDKKRKRAPKRTPRERYTVASYRRAIARACDLAFPPSQPLAQRKGETKEQWMGRLTSQQKQELAQWQKAHRWHPHQLRHNAGTRLRKEFGLEVARAVLGHRTPVVTEIYAELDSNLAVEVMEKVG